MYLPTCATPAPISSESMPCHIVLPKRDSDPSQIAPPTWAIVRAAVMPRETFGFQTPELSRLHKWSMCDHPQFCAAADAGSVRATATTIVPSVRKDSVPDRVGPGNARGIRAGRRIADDLGGW